jgi:hypothetical protein
MLVDRREPMVRAWQLAGGDADVSALIEENVFAYADLAQVLVVEPRF